jgi:hypothetical protein
MKPYIFLYEKMGHHNFGRDRIGGLAVTAQRWLATFLCFVGANSVLIQGLSDLAQLVLWLSSGLALLGGLWRAKKTNSTIAPKAMITNSVKAAHNSVAIGSNVSNSTIGSRNIVGKRIEIRGDVVGRDQITNIYATPVATINALHQLPPPPRDFTGRVAELNELMTALEKGGVTMQGMGGVGKTTLALKLAELLTPRYPDAQFFLDLKGVSSQPLTAAETMAHVIRAYRPSATLPESESELGRFIFPFCTANARFCFLTMPVMPSKSSRFCPRPLAACSSPHVYTSPCLDYSRRTSIFCRLKMPASFC